MNRKKVRELVMERDGEKCFDCGIATTEQHHILPRSSAGRKAKHLIWRVENMIVLCGRCHRDHDAHNPVTRARHLRKLVELYGYVYEDQRWRWLLL